MREKLNNATLFRPDTYEAFLKEVPKGRVITCSSVSDKFKITASLARKVLKDMAAKDLIKPVVSHNTLLVFTRTDEQTKLADEKAAAALKAEQEQIARKCKSLSPFQFFNL